MGQIKKVKREGIWLRGVIDVETHTALYNIKLRINSSGADKVKLEDIAMECIRLGMPLYIKKQKV